MHTSLQPIYDKLQADLHSLYEELKGHPDVVLNKKKDEKTWSPLQVMHHLILAEGGSLQYVKKKMSFNPAYEKAGIKTGFRSILLKTYMAAPIKVKAPDFIGDASLPIESTFWETVKVWNKQREELRIFLDEFPDDLLNKEVYKHAFAGRLTIKQMLHFFDIHFLRHRKQIRRTIKDYHFVV